VPSPHMTPDEFRRQGHTAVEWVASYLERLEDLPVVSLTQPGEVRAKLPPEPPAGGDSIDAILRDLDDIILPGLTHWQSPNFFAYFPANTSGPAILGEFLSAGLNIQGMLWATSPAATELETHVMDWLAEMLDLPLAFRSTGTGGGVIEGSASESSLCAIVAAREKATGYVTNRTGVHETLVAYCSTQTHSSVEKGIRIAGIGSDRLRQVDVDETYALSPSALEAAIVADKAAGLHPFLVIATVGTTSSNAIDPLPAIGEICRRYGLWLHVDAAYAGAAAVCPEFRFVNEGVELVDSYVFDPHKWLFGGIEASCFYVADREALTRALTILPEYLRNAATATGQVIDYRDWQIPLGHRFRSLKLWMMLRYYGVEGLRTAMRAHVAMTREFLTWVEADDRFEVAAPAPLNLVCFRHKGLPDRAGDAVNQAILDQVNASGHAFISHTRLDDRLTLRFCVGQEHTERRHVERAWGLIQQAAEAVEGRG
jgi:aromatic-L-amino-acid decarboxylase